MDTTTESTVSVPAPVSAFIPTRWIDVHAGTLAAAVRFAAAPVPKRPTRPAVGWVHLEVVAASLRVTGTDLETYARATVGIVAHGPAHPPTFALDPVRLGALLASVPEHATVRLEDRPDRVALLVDRTEVGSLERHDPEEYPVAPSVAIAAPIGSVRLGELRSALVHVIPAIARDQGRYAMHGGLLTVDQRTGETVLVGTDGRRLHVAPLVSDARLADALTGAAARRESLIVPRRGLERWAKGWPRALRADDAVALHLGSHYVHASAGGFTLTVRRIDGEFPRYSAVIPQDPPQRIDVSREDLATAARQSAKLWPKGDPVFCLHLAPDEDAGRLALATRLKGEPILRAHVDATMEQDKGRADARGWRLNPAFLADALAGLASDRVRIGWTSETDPIVVRDGLDGRGRLAVIMPVTVDC